MSAEEETWRAFHVFYFDEAHVDPLILEAETLISGVSSLRPAWFFIRYNLGGMHLRFRLRGRFDRFDEVLLRLRERAWMLSESPLEAAKPPAGGVPDERGHLHYPGSVVEIPYAPETERYGGPHVLPVNEALFERSTALAVRIIAATVGDRPMRAKLAVDLMLAAASIAVDGDCEAGAFFEDYARFWERRYFTTGEKPAGTRTPGRAAIVERLRQLRDDAASGAAPRTPSQIWLGDLIDAKGKFQALASSGKLLSPRNREIVADDGGFAGALSDMLGSQMHMMNNRLGFGPFEEMTWSDALARSLAE